MSTVTLTGTVKLIRGSFDQYIFVDEKSNEYNIPALDKQGLNGTFNEKTQYTAQYMNAGIGVAGFLPYIQEGSLAPVTDNGSNFTL